MGVFIFPENKLFELLEFSKKGPKHAKVESINYEFANTKNEYDDFDYDV